MHTFSGECQSTPCPGAVGNTAVFEVHYRRSETPVQQTTYPMKVAHHPDTFPDAPEQTIYRLILATHPDHPLVKEKGKTQGNRRWPKNVN